MENSVSGFKDFMCTCIWSSGSCCHLERLNDSRSWTMTVRLAKCLLLLQSYWLKEGHTIVTGLYPEIWKKVGEPVMHIISGDTSWVERTYWDVDPGNVLCTNVYQLVSLTRVHEIDCISFHIGL